MKFGVREICDVVLRAKAAQKIGNKIFYKNEPVIYFDTLKTSSMEGAATTVYAQGGRGNSRLMAWEGERTVTFTMEDALISPEGFMILSGAGLIEAGEGATIKQHVTETIDASNINSTNGSILTEKVTKYYYKKGEDKIELSKEEYDSQTVPEVQFPSASNFTSEEVEVETAVSGEMSIELSNVPYVGEQADGDFIFVMLVKDGEIVSEPIIPDHGAVEGKTITIKNGSRFNHIAVADCDEHEDVNCANGYKLNDMVSGSNGAAEKHECNYHAASEAGHTFLGVQFDSVIVDYYVEHKSGAKQIEITADKFGGNYYLEASTLFRDTNGVDMPAEFIIPNCKIQSNFTFSMASSGDPSTFTFTMDAFPDYTRFDHSKKVLAAIQIIEAGGSSQELYRHATRHEDAHDELSW